MRSATATARPYRHENVLPAPPPRRTLADLITPRRLLVLLIAHLAALAFGLGGLLIAFPHPELWADSELGRRTFDFGVSYGGSLHIILGALAMFAFGTRVLGFGRTAAFFVISFGLSLSSELIGTGTGWPFGNYEYTSFLGYKVLGRVPFTIPLSWFYMGLACYLLAFGFAKNLGRRRVEPWALAIGVWLLIVWDLVLDPAMAHKDLTVKFWEWHQTGPYYGMPVQNYAGWAATGLVYMGLSRLIWGDGVEPASAPMWFPFAIYLANTVFAMALSASVDLYLPILLSLVLGVIPAALALPIGPFRPSAARAAGRPAGETARAALRPSATP